MRLQTAFGRPLVGSVRSQLGQSGPEPLGPQGQPRHQGNGHVASGGYSKNLFTSAAQAVASCMRKPCPASG